MTAAHDIRPPALARRGPAGHLFAGAVLVFVLFAAQVVRVGLVSPDLVARVAVRNPSIWDVRVQARPAEGGGWLDLGLIDREQTSTWVDVLDQGARWELAFESRGRTSRIVVAREEVVGDGVILRVPATLLDRLERDGEVPSACPAGRICAARS